MTFPLSKSEIKTLSEAKERIASSPFLSDKERQLYHDALSLMIEEGLVQRRDSMGRAAYVVVGDVDVFDQWVQLQNKKAMRLSRRDWRIAITAAVAGALVGLVPTILRALLS